MHTTVPTLIIYFIFVSMAIIVLFGGLDNFIEFLTTGKFTMGDII